MKELLEQLQQVREEIKVKKEFLDEAKTRKEQIEFQVLEAMKSQELKSARYENLTATIAERNTLKVVDEKEVVVYLKEKGLTDYLSERPNDLFEVFRKQAEKEKVEVPGMEMQSTEYLSIRSKKVEE
jgi:hypothetical protein